MHDAIVIGAGVGGLAAAIALAAEGLDVHVVESASGPGGKAGTVVVDGVEIDTGPSVLTLPKVFDDLFALAGTSLASEIRLLRPEPSFRYLFPDGVRLEIHHEIERTLESVGKALGAKASVELESFMAYSRRIWETAAPVFVYGDAPNVMSVMAQGISGLARMSRIDPWSRMGPAIASRVSSPHLRMLLARYATYNGSDPRVAPATLNCIAHVELALGGFGVAGGMHELVRALVRVAERLGVSWSFDTRVARIETGAGAVTGIVTETGARLGAPVVVSNVEVRHLVEDLLPRETAHGLPLDGRPSMSAVNAILRARRQAEPRVAHTVLFPDDYEAEFADIFDREHAPRSPTVYLCAQEACHGRSGWPSDEPIFVMANAPAVGGGDDVAAQAALLARTIARARGAGLIGDDDTVVWSRTPADLALRFPGSRGSLYGTASNGALAAFQRPPNALSKVKGLYLASGTAHPGGGVPLAALSGRAAARAALRPRRARMIA